MCILILFEVGGEIKPSAEYNFCLVFFFFHKNYSQPGVRFPKAFLANYGH